MIDLIDDSSMHRRVREPRQDDIRHLLRRAILGKNPACMFKARTSLPLACAVAALWSTQAWPDVIVGTGQPSARTLGSPTASQVRVVPNDFGHGLIVPYYTTNGNNVTAINIVNEDPENGKIARLRLRSAGDGAAIFSVTLLLAPSDTWTGLLSMSPSGVTQLSTNDASCTRPDMRGGTPVAAGIDRLPASLGVSEKTAQTREGYVEVINMADVPRQNIYGADGFSFSVLITAINNWLGNPPPCPESALQILDEDLKDERIAASLGLAAPTGGLAGRWMIWNGPKGLTHSGGMHAVQAVTAEGRPGRGNFMLFPQTGAAIAPAQIDRLTADPVFRTRAFARKGAMGQADGIASGAVEQARAADLPDFSTPLVMPPDASAPLLQAGLFTAASAAKSATNEFFSVPDVHGETLWALSFPAKRFSVAVHPSGAGLLYSMVPPSGPQYFHDANTVLSNQRTCHTLLQDLQYRWFDRERERERTMAHNPAAPAQGAVQVCGAADVATFLPGRSARQNFGLAAHEGRVRLNLQSADTGLGLPLVGLGFFSAVNPAVAPGVSANFGWGSEHWYERP
jgi:hypothetical protein